MVHQSYWEHLDKGILEMKPTSHPICSLYFLQSKKISTTEYIDCLVSAELPLAENAPLFETITKCLLHGPCGQEYPTHPAWSTVYAKNNICELSPRKQHKAKIVTLSTIGETMVKRFKSLKMALRTTTDGWCPTTPTLPRCLMHILMSRCPLVF
jgi:hypothetical protein